MLSELPYEVLLHLFEFLEIEAYITLEHVNRRLRACVIGSIEAYINRLIKTDIGGFDFAKVKRFVYGRCSVDGVANLSGVWFIFQRIAETPYVSRNRFRRYLKRAGRSSPVLLQRIMEQSMTSMLSVLLYQHFSVLKELDLSCNGFGNSDMLRVIETLSTYATHVRLRKLNFAHNSITNLEYFKCIQNRLDDCNINLENNDLYLNTCNGKIFGVNYVNLKHNLLHSKSVMPVFCKWSDWFSIDSRPQTALTLPSTRDNFNRMWIAPTLEAKESVRQVRTTYKLNKKQDSGRYNKRPNKSYR